MKKLIAFMLLVALVGQSFNQGWYYLSYLLEKKEYMKRCENKARPLLHCNGKCQLMKKIKEQQQKEQEQPPELKLAAKAEVFSEKSTISLLPPPVKELSAAIVICTIGTPVNRPSDLFRPPDIA